MLVNVVEKGHGKRAGVPGYYVAGKTGTAQNPHGKDHSVFVAFAPKDNPKIAIAVTVENAGWGGTWAAPIATLMIEEYLRDSISRPDLDKRMREGVILPEGAQFRPQPKDTSKQQPKTPPVTAVKVRREAVLKEH
jgi:penicillin-binding protein 2